jgi:3-methyladenine DNA glycosylase AlkD
MREPSTDEKELFLRKTIGWALREYSKTDGGEVMRYVKQYQDRLSPASKHEALKVLLSQARAVRRGRLPACERGGHEEEDRAARRHAG